MRAAIGLAQLEKIDSFVKLRIDITNMFLDVMRDWEYLIPQKTPEGYVNTYWTVAVKYELKNVPWQEFRKNILILVEMEFMSLGH
ncbi:MAG: DegT/DnrJ/EryC1/StrS family aminotransferase [Candidatus Marinimicrobia bacterium]|nr:DegT/DnrJ/EryC1/StrS family aminotransferase [Candidatus Neomarinimicrobiota bacterium]